MAEHVAVIGAGIIGAASAVALLDTGHAVTLIEPGEPGGEQAASYGNGCWISPASVVPMSMPGLWKQVPGFLLDPLGPLTLRWTALPALAPWLVRFLLAGATVPKVEATARALSALLHDAPDRHAKLAAQAGCPDLIQRKGLLYAYPTRAAFEAEALSWRLRRDNGVVWREYQGDAVRALEPSLDPRYRFAVHVEGGAHTPDPGAYTAALVAYAVSRGAMLRREKATGFVIEGGMLRAVQTDKGGVVCTKAVIAAGVRSAPLARAAGDNVPLASERGYHVVLAQPEAAPAIPVMPSDGKMGNTLTPQGLRAAGQVELATTDAAPNWARADVLLKHLLATYPGLARTPAPERLSRWLGHRPSTPDGKPVIARASGCADVVHAFGHGHVGLAAAPATAELVAALVSGEACSLNPAPYSARRF